MPQDVQLLPGTVAENIARLGEVDAEAVVAAARAAGAHEMVLELPSGYDTVIEPGSTLLSPGQRQRIALARALYGQPCLLLLDEPNANLDGLGEQRLGEALAALRGKVTVVMVTHRSPLVAHADKMLLLEAGRVRQFGPVTEVMQAMRQAGQTGQGATAGAVQLGVEAQRWAR
jgi:ABC-type protease/lipase transport system fused ATPase/permease subunit